MLTRVGKDPALANRQEGPILSRLPEINGRRILDCGHGSRGLARDQR
jgi:hypothetical protein